MDASQAEAMIKLIDEAGVSQERRRHESAGNRRGEMGLVVANAMAAGQIQQPDETAQVLEAAAKLLADPT